MPANKQPARIVITLESVMQGEKEMISCECQVNDGFDDFLNHTAVFLSGKLKDAAQKNINDAMYYAHHKQLKVKRGIH